MIVEKKFLNRLKDFGLNSYEAKIWTALLSRGISSAGELSDISNVPRSRTYDVLEGLEKKGFIIMKIGKPIKYIAVPPEEVIERVKKKVQEDAEKQSNLLDELKEDDVLGELNTLFSKGVEVVEPTDLSGALRDRGNVYENMNMLIKQAKESILLMTTEQGLIRKADALRKQLEKAKKRGIEIRIAAPITDASRKAVKVFQNIGEVRHVDSIKARMLVADNKEIIFNLLDDSVANPAYDVGIWVNAPFFASAVTGLFEQAWDSAKEVN